MCMLGFCWYVALFGCMLRFVGGYVAGDGDDEQEEEEDDDDDEDNGGRITRMRRRRMKGSEE